MAKEKTKEQKTLVIPGKGCPRAIEISEEEILRRAERIKPVVRFAIDSKGKLHRDDSAMTGEMRLTESGGLFKCNGEPYWNFDGLYYIRPVDLFNTAFTWDPKPTKRAEPELVRLDDIITHHYFAGAFFKPTQAEVLGQIPSEQLEKVVAFETIPLTGLVMDIYSHGCIVAHTRLYTTQETADRAIKEVLRKIG